MTDIYLNNSLTRKKEKFVPLIQGKVGIYSCGPTVYWNQHIGHMYAYVQWDVTVRLLRYLGYEVKWVMNVTDVGHLTSDGDSGEDKMEKGAKREGASVWDIADKYIKQFVESLELLNVHKPDVLPRATDHIKEQIGLIEKIEKNGFSYKTKKGVIFDTSKFSDYSKFAGLKLDRLQTGKDVEEDLDKKLPWDFFLWVTGNKEHIMQWDSPWGKGYPGWHIECTAMSTKYLGDKFDIHTGGMEHIPVHHTNEVAQGFAAFGEKTANYWLHNAWLMGKGGEKMSKSLGNFVTAQQLVEKGYDPIAMRYLILTSHYRKGLNFTWESLTASQSALMNLREIVSGLKSGQPGRTALSEEKLKKVDDFRERFIGALSDDLNAPQALAILWEMLKSNVPAEDKYDLALSFDEVLGLKLNIEAKAIKIPEKVKEMTDEREQLRKEGKFGEADKLRVKIEEAGYTIEDTEKSSKLKSAK